ncbi:hypothetical protein AAHA92_01743 [Salvia divinorum]|uniref:Uncharacterized protein n=1 Tax=Salvia divinorum TaxID=28513 RepID=A0ABD1IBJ8_SALDI
MVASPLNKWTVSATCLHGLVLVEYEVKLQVVNHKCYDQKAEELIKTGVEIRDQLLCEKLYSREIGINKHKITFGIAGSSYHVFV